MLSWLEGYLAKKQIENPVLEAQSLLALALAKSRMEILLSFDALLSDATKARLKDLLQQRVSGVPLAYLEGQVYFWDFFLKVDRRVLIPRKETELLVELVLTTLSKEAEEPLRLLDLGTGSGAIALALISEHPKLQIAASDISQDALKLAQENCAALQSLHPETPFQIEWIESDLFANPVFQQKKFAVIVTNLPYVAEEAYPSLSKEVHAEPKLALTAGKDGLAFYTQFFQQAPDFLLPAGKVFLEHGYDQKSALLALSEPKFRLLQAVKDYSGNDRILALELKA